jgi:hypothetical protein
MRKILLAAGVLGLLPVLSVQSALANDLAMTESVRNECRAAGFPYVNTGFEQCQSMVLFYQNVCMNRGIDGAGLGMQRCIQLGLMRERDEGVAEARMRDSRYAIAQVSRSR